MNMHGRFLIALGVGLLSFQAIGAGVVVDRHIAAKNLTAEEAEVWKAEDEYWGRSGCCGHEDLVSSGKWLDYLADDAMVWSGAGPQSKSSMKMWHDAEGAYEGTRLDFELYPQATVIHGNMAILYYRFRVVTLTKDSPNKPSVSNGSFVDVWVRDRPGARWKYITWNLVKD